MVDLLTDVPLKVSVEVGSKKVLIRDIFGWSEGAILELAERTGDTLAVRVNGRLVARGELVVVNDRIGVRLTEIIPTVEEGETRE